jgi:predicted nuclease of predicted toxin-antitoxin system
MKIKLDENVTTGVLPALKTLGHDVQTTIEAGLTGKPDDEIWSAAQLEERFLVTQDMEFSDARKFAPGEHPGILFLRLHSPNPAAIVSRIAELFEDEDVETWKRYFVVATEHKVRVVRR